MLRNYENTVIEMIRGQRRGTGPALVLALLSMASWCYGAAMAVRDRCYRWGVFKQKRCAVPVISIGNITTGGTGKTPVTLLLASAFYKKVPLAILSRGYRSAAEKDSSPLLLSHGTGPRFPAAVGGDEPYLLARNLPEALVIVGRNRCRAAAIAIDRGAKLLILDDGLQHRQLARDIDIVVIDAADPLGGGRLLPRGFLRESPAALSRADFIIINNGDGGDHLAARTAITPFTNAPIIVTAPTISAIATPDGDGAPPLKGKRVGMFCSIAKPYHFQRLLDSAGAHIVTTSILPDHIGITADALGAFAAASIEQGAEALVCTEKDAVRLPKEVGTLLPIYQVKITLEIIDGFAAWNNLLALIDQKV